MVCCGLVWDWGVGDGAAVRCGAASELGAMLSHKVARASHVEDSVKGCALQGLR